MPKNKFLKLLSQYKYIKHEIKIMRARDFIIEAKPETLGQGMLDKLFATYTKRDVDDNLLPKKFESGLEVANYIYQYVGPAFLIWSSKQYNQDQHFFLHDLPAWKSTLDEFVKVAKNRQYQIEKDINKYQDINQLRQAIQQAVTPKEQEQVSFYDRIIPRLNQYVEQNNARWIYRGKDYSIYLPVTWESSREASRACNIKEGGACVTLSKNLFDSYTGGTNGQKGTLVFTIGQDSIYIAYLTKKGVHKSEFSDINNNHEFDLTYQLTNFPNLKPVLNRLVSPDDDRVKIQLTDDPTEQIKIANKMVKNNSMALRFVPRELITPELCKLAVEQESRALVFVPEQLKTPELCKIAVKENGTALDFVPEEFKTPKLCRIAVEDNSQALQYVPEQLRTPELCKIAVSKDSWTLQYVPEKLRTPELCKIAVSEDSWTLHYVPKQLKTPELCKIAVSKDGQALRHVPEELKTPELCKIAVSKDGQALLYVPEELKTPELCKIAVKENGRALQYVPQRLEHLFTNR